MNIFVNVAIFQEYKYKVIFQFVKFYVDWFGRVLWGRVRSSFMERGGVRSSLIILFSLII